jgi:hypothetical protein
VFKNGDRIIVSQLLPVSLLTSFPKVLDKIIYDRLIKHIQINNILVEEKFGFRTSSSTVNKLNDGILNVLVKKMMVGGIFCNLQKAFSCVNYSSF